MDEERRQKEWRGGHDTTVSTR
jgi:hypothetical protein